MKVLVVGDAPVSGELVAKLQQSPKVDVLYSWPRQQHTFGKCKKFPLDSAATITDLARSVRQLEIDLVVLGSENAIASGLANVLETYRVPCFGPTSVAAHFHWDVEFCSNLVKKAGVESTIISAAYSPEHAMIVANEALFSKGPIVLRSQFSLSYRDRYLCTTKSDIERCVRLLFANEPEMHRNRTVVVEKVTSGFRCSYNGFVDAGRVESIGYVAETTSANGVQVKLINELVNSKSFNDATHKSIMTNAIQPILKAMKSEGIAYNGWLSVEIVLRDGVVYVAGMKAFPDERLLSALANKDRRDWAQLMSVNYYESLQPRLIGNNKSEKQGRLALIRA